MAPDFDTTFVSVPGFGSAAATKLVPTFGAGVTVGTGRRRGFVAVRYVVYTVAPTRGSEVLIRLLGAVFGGVLCSDRFSAYLKYHSGKAQFCWAHLKRNLMGIVEFTKSSAVEQFCRDALAQYARLFRLWHKFRGGRKVEPILPSALRS